MAEMEIRAKLGKALADFLPVKFKEHKNGTALTGEVCVVASESDENFLYYVRGKTPSDTDANP